MRLGAKHGADLVFIETMNDSYETKAALLAAHENCDLPVVVSNAYGADGKLMTGATPSAMVALLEGMGVTALGANCSLGPAELRGVMDELLACASVPVLFKPNAGLPQAVDGKTVYNVTPEAFAAEVADAVRRGVRAAGGCCGTTPDYIRALAAAVEGAAPVPIAPKNLSVASSYTHAVRLGDDPVLIGERINPTGKKRVKEALREGNLDFILAEGVAQAEKGAQILDVNAGLPDIDECAVLPHVVCELQAVTDLPASDRHGKSPRDGGGAPPLQRQGRHQFGKRQAREHGGGLPAREKVRRHRRGAHAGRGRHPRDGGGAFCHREEDSRRGRALWHRQKRPAF